MAPINRQDLTRKIQGLTALSADERSALLELLNTRKKYGLVWEDKPEKVEDDLRTQFPILTEVSERRIVGTGGQAPNHVLIEGDNLHALTALQYTHEGKVDVIYIDPPYNTGNKDFVYNDHFVDKEDQWRHSKWLSFMEKRLKLAKLLLKETGVIFISIDENEHPQVRLLCNELFGEPNFITTITNVNNPKGRSDDKFVATAHESLVLYCKDKDRAAFFGFEAEDHITRRYTKIEKGKRYREIDLRKTGDNDRRQDRENLFYYFYFDEASSNLFPSREKIEGQNFIEIAPLRKDGSEGNWRWGLETSAANIDKLVARFMPNRKIWGVFEKDFLEGRSLTKPTSAWTFKEVNSERGSESFIELGFKKEDFLRPKPVGLLKRILLASTQKSAVGTIILDFFAGSGTTLHATMALNAEDGGPRQCILVTNNENGICENVTYERGRRVIQGYTNAKGAAVPGLTGNSLRYYRTGFVSRERGQKNRRKLTRASVDLLCLKEDCYAERADLTNPERRVFENADHLLFVLFDAEAIPETVAVIAAQGKHCKVYVFSPGAYAWDDDFEDVRDKITLCALPEALIQAFQKVMPPEGEPARYESTGDDESEVGE